MRIRAALLVLLCGAFAPIAQTRTQQAPSFETDTASPAVLVELFTSEGCSTCPPADRLLVELDQIKSSKGAQVIALSEHVDYWNRLGWKDPFSSAQFSQRQEDYSRALGFGDVYTPQMVVDGRTAFVGSKRALALEEIAKAALAQKANVQLSMKMTSPNAVTVAAQVDRMPEISRGDRADVMLAVAESGLLSKVSRGENAGREIAHVAVTRRLLKIGTIDGSSFSAQQNVRLDSAWKLRLTKVVVFLQERNSRRVLGAAMIKITGES